MKPLAAPALRTLRAYQVPRPPIPIDLRLDGNEGLLPADEYFEDLRAAGPEVLRNYPDARPLEALLAQRHGVSAESVLVTAGADEALDRLLRAFTWPGREVVLPWPSFVMIPHYAQLAGATLRTIAWPSGSFPLRAALDAVNEHTGLVFCVTPNNPTGAWATRADLTALSQGAGAALVVLDHAYAEFADEDLSAFALSLENVLVLRTFSKARGLAGIRVGYAVGAPAVVRVLRAAGGPYPVSAASLVIARAALRRSDPRERAYVEAVRAERARLPRVLQDLGAQALPSQGNFVLARFHDAELVRDFLAGLGIGVRLFPGERALEGALRITCPGDPVPFRRLEHALAATLAPEALLLDLDGVLVDARSEPARALVELALVAELQKRLPLAIVSGLRRAAVARILTAGGLAPLVSVAIAAEDAPAKPEPDGVRLALERLGVRRAWMVGDNPTDMRAARAAGVVPLGSLPPELRDSPEGDRKDYADVLHTAGAARILGGLAELPLLLDRARTPLAESASLAP